MSREPGWDGEGRGGDGVGRGWDGLCGAACGAVRPAAALGLAGALALALSLVRWRRQGGHAAAC